MGEEMPGRDMGRVYDAWHIFPGAVAAPIQILCSRSRCRSRLAHLVSAIHPPHCREAIMPTPKRHASTILGAFEQARTELIGKAVILTDGKAGTVENVWLDEFHGLRISIKCHDGRWPVSTIKFTQS